MLTRLRTLGRSWRGHVSRAPFKNTPFSSAMVRRKLEQRAFLKGPRAEYEWRAERLAKPKSFSGILTDAQPLRWSPAFPRKKAALRASQAGKMGKRRDLILWVGDLGREVYWHRAVAFAWSSTYEVQGGAKKPLPKTWAGFEASGLVVDHGGVGPGKVLIDALTVCTERRNMELERERAQAAAEKTRKRAAELSAARASRKARAG